MLIHLWWYYQKIITSLLFFLKVKEAPMIKFLFFNLQVWVDWKSSQCWRWCYCHAALCGKFRQGWLCTRGHWAPLTSALLSLSLLVLRVGWNFDSSRPDERSSLTQRGRCDRRSEAAREGWVCFCYWLNAARASHTAAATRISCCRHVHSHKAGVDIAHSHKAVVHIAHSLKGVDIVH